MVGNLNSNFSHLIIAVHTQESQETFQLGQHHGTIFIFVVQFAQFKVVMVGSLVIGLLDGFLHQSDNFIKLAIFFLVIVSLTVLDTNFLDDIQAQCVKDVHEIVHVKRTFAMPVIDLTDPYNFFSILYEKNVKKVSNH